MNTVGLIGGMSWESTSLYYSLINKGYNRARGANHSAPCLIHSLDFQEVENAQYAGDWEGLAGLMADSGRRLKAAGAGVALVCSNTMHRVLDGFTDRTGLPLPHIADAVGRACRAGGLGSLGLIGTAFTMEGDFYRGWLERHYGLEILVPEAAERQEVNRVIYQELVKGIIRPESANLYRRVMDALAERGAEGIILGCTEIGLLVKDHPLPLVDSTLVHAEAGVDWLLQSN